MDPQQTLDQLTEPWPPGEAPYLDQPDARTTDPLAEQWRRDGYVILPGLIPDDLTAAYADAWRADNGPDGRFGDRPGGWSYDTPYMHVPALRDIACHQPLTDVLARLIGDPMGVHLNLTGWRSTQRDWHQDGYLNPDSNRDWYAAVWVAIDDIHPDSGPFEFIPGSHRRYGIIRQDAMLAMLDPSEHGPEWPRHSERILTPMFEALMARDGLHSQRFHAKRGDVLVWHARLLHRGSPPADAGMERRGLIMHYSGVTKRPDMPAAKRWRDGWYFPIDQGGHR